MKFFKKLWVRIVAVILAVTLVVFSALLILNTFAPNNPKCYHVFGLSGINGSFNKKGNPTTYYTAEPKKIEGHEYYEFTKIKLEKGKAAFVYVNVSDLWENNLTIYLRRGENASGPLIPAYEGKTIKDENDKDVVLMDFILDAKTLKKDKDGWIKINLKYRENEIHYTYYLAFSTKVNIREVVFADIDNNPLKYDVVSYLARGNIDATEKGANEYTLEDINTYKDLDNSQNLKASIISMKNINDEQKTFSSIKE